MDKPGGRGEKAAAAPAGVVIGTIAGFDQNGSVLVAFHGATSPWVARHVCQIRPEDGGREVVLTFESGDLRKPVILGLVQSAVAVAAPSLDVTVDGERLSFVAKEEIVLRCGKASITLTRAGKVLIRGAYVLTRSSGVNRIKGGSVQIN